MTQPARNACLAIGVSDAPPLDFLPGALNGARAIARWAEAHGYVTKLLTDADDPIGIDTIADAIAELLPRGAKTDRLLLYFAGHGLSRDAGEDLWLLSQWHDLQRAVGVSGLRRKLERFGVGQLILVSDACRNVGSDADTADLTPDQVLGRGPFEGQVLKADILKASSRYSAAYMIPGDDIDADRCIFSGLLIEALWGRHDGAFSTTRQTRCITSKSLEQFLDEAVPKQAAVYGVELRPDIVTGLPEARDLYLETVPDDPPSFPPWPERSATGAMGAAVRSAATGQRGWSTRSADDDAAARPRARAIDAAPSRRFSAPRRAPALVRIAEAIARDRSQVRSAEASRTARADAYVAGYADEGERPTHFETSCGFSLSGGRARSVHLGRHGVGRSERDGTWFRVDRPDGEPELPWWTGCTLRLPLPLLVELDRPAPIWIGAAAAPQFVTTFTADASGAQSIVLRRVNRPGHIAADAERAIAALRAGGLGPEDSIDLAVRLRQGKERDPMLGVIAAYLYDARGDVDGVRQTAHYLADALGWVPFDLVLLGRMPVSRDQDGVAVATIPAVAERSPRTRHEADNAWTTAATAAGRVPVAGAFPWLRQGWALIDDATDAADDVLALGALGELRGSLVNAAPFTTLDAAGGARLAAIIAQGG